MVPCRLHPQFKQLPSSVGDALGIDMQSVGRELAGRPVCLPEGLLALPHGPVLLR